VKRRLVNITKSFISLIKNTVAANTFECVKLLLRILLDASTYCWIYFWLYNSWL